MPLPIPKDRMVKKEPQDNGFNMEKPMSHVALKRHHQSLPKASPIIPENEPSNDKPINGDELPYDSSLDFGDGDALNLNDDTYEDPSPSLRKTTPHDDDEEFPVAHRSEFDDHDDIPEFNETNPMHDDAESDTAYADDEENDDHLEEPRPKEKDNDENEVEEPNEQEPDTESGKKHDMKSWLNSLMNKVKNEIGVDDEGDKTGEELVPSSPVHDKSETPTLPKKKTPKSSSIISIIGYPLRVIMSMLRGASKLMRIILSLSGILMMLVMVWLVCNIIPAVSNSSTDFSNDEGSVSVENVSYNDGKVSFTAKNNSDMIAHAFSSATVKAWKPDVSNIKTILMPIRVMSCTPSISGDIMPGKSQEITLQCNGNEGIWMRPIVKVTTG